MVKFASIGASVVATVIALAPAANAGTYVAVNSNGVWHKHHTHHLARVDVAKFKQDRQVYYSGDYADVSREAGTTYVYAYPGVSVIVGHGHGVRVSVGY